MPNITTYVENELYIKFLNEPDEKRKMIRKKIVELVKNEVNDNETNDSREEQFNG